MTFSIAARCSETGMFGIAISSSSPAVAARCVHARAGVGAVCSQNVTDPALGSAVLDLLALGLSAEAAIEQLAGRPSIEYRQLLAVDREGRSAHFSGGRTLGRHAAASGAGVVAAGNLLADLHVPAAMVERFESERGSLGDRLIAALAAGLERGGEAGPVHSAGLLLVDRVSWPVADLRVDWSEDGPIAALGRLWALYAPQMADYLARALDPAAAPGYGVPGDAR
jgi:uncharacterized Ntn-hydrolase superfamily protein